MEEDATVNQSRTSANSETHGDSMYALLCPDILARRSARSSSLALLKSVCCPMARRWRMRNATREGATTSSLWENERVRAIRRQQSRIGDYRVWPRVVCRSDTSARGERLRILRKSLDRCGTLPEVGRGRHVSMNGPASTKTKFVTGIVV